VRENNQNPSSVRLLSKHRGALAFFLTRADAGPGPGPDRRRRRGRLTTRRRRPMTPRVRANVRTFEASRASETIRRRAVPTDQGREDARGTKGRARARTRRGAGRAIEGRTRLDFEGIKKFFHENGATTRRSTTAATRRRETDRTASRSAGLRLISETSESESESEGESAGDACRRERRAGTPTASFVHRR